MDVAARLEVRTLEARFYPATKSGGRFVVVGRVVFDQNRASIERTKVSRDAVRPFDSDRLHEKLEFLVTAVVGDRVSALLSLESGYWSFIEAPDLDRRPGAA